MPLIRSVRLTKGKADFVKRVMPSGKIIDICLLEWNADMTQGCMAQVPYMHLDEVVQNNGKYAPGNFLVYKANKTGDKRCDYCYAWGKNSGPVNPFVVDERTRNDFDEHKPKFVRIGKSTEPGHPYYWNSLRDFLNLCKEHKSIPILTTKMLPYGIEGARSTNVSEFYSLSEKVNFPKGEEIAELLKNTKTSLLYSLGYDSLEPGVCSQGCTNEWRIAQAIDYFKQGVNTSLTVVSDVTDSIDNNASRGSFIKRALEEKEKYGINVRVIPARLYTYKSTVTITGSRKKVLTSAGYHQTSPLEGISDHSPIIGTRYHAASMLKLIPNYIHSDFKDLIEQGLGVCGAAAGTEHCDKCNCFGKTRISFPDSELPKIIFENPTRRQEQARRAKNRADKNQLKFKLT